MRSFAKVIILPCMHGDSLNQFEKQLADLSESLPVLTATTEIVNQSVVALKRGHHAKLVQRLADEWLPHRRSHSYRISFGPSYCHHW